jgi:hypothetical protein
MFIFGMAKFSQRPAAAVLQTRLNAALLGSSRHLVSASRLIDSSTNVCQQPIHHRIRLDDT